VIDNEADAPIVRRKGERFTTPQGIVLRYDDDCEHYDEVSTREQKRCKTPYFGTVDADFELLKPDFFLTMLRRLETDETLAGISTDYSATSASIFDSYSGETIMLQERWHTWCCLYRSAVAPYLNEVSSFYYEQQLPDGRRHAFDSYSHFQHLLIRKYGFRFATLDRSNASLFIMGASQRISRLLRRISYCTVGLASQSKPVSEPPRASLTWPSVASPVCRSTPYSLER
jgi:hypothetical protein